MISMTCFGSYEKHLEEGTLSECVAESLAEKGVDAASFHAYDRQVKELAVLRGLERLRPGMGYCA